MTITKGQLVVIPCMLGYGDFPQLLGFSIPMGDGGEYARIVDVGDCLGSNLEPLVECMPPPGECISGYIKGRAIEVHGDIVRIRVPNGDIIELPAARLG